jgi:pimeloyl-ACP methyl ester carboxylesterase
MSSRFQLDPECIYLAGVSGGGHMSMLMAGHHPDRFSAVSAWVGISDLEDWHRFHLKKNMENGYHRMIEASLGGAPGVSPERDADYRDRSPIHWLHRTGDLPVELAAGVHDGHTGSVPVSHSLRAFNVIARAGGYPMVTDDELNQLTVNRSLRNPMPSDLATDETLGRKIHLRRIAGVSRVTVFEGGHEGLPAAACGWLQQQRRRAKPSATGN